MPPVAAEPGEGGLARCQRVALDLHVDEELRGQPDQSRPHEHQADLGGDVGEEDELPGREPDAGSDDAGSDDAPGRAAALLVARGPLVGAGTWSGRDPRRSPPAVVLRCPVVVMAASLVGVGRTCSRLLPIDLRANHLDSLSQEFVGRAAGSRAGERPPRRRPAASRPGCRTDSGRREPAGRRRRRPVRPDQERR